MEIVLKSINDLSARVTDELAHQGRSVTDDDQQPMPVSAVGNRQVDAAIDASRNSSRYAERFSSI